MIFQKKIISDDQELHTFNNLVEKNLNIKFPIEYLKQGKVRVFKNSKGKILGGYVMVLNGPFRTLLSIPNKRIVSEVDQDKTIEVTGLWLDRSIKTGWLSFYFWITFSQDLSSFDGKDSFIYAYELRKKSLTKLYAHAKPRILFRGKTLKLEGMRKESVESIEIANCKFIRLLPITASMSLLKKVLGKRAVLRSKKLLS